MIDDDDENNNNNKDNNGKHHHQQQKQQQRQHIPVVIHAFSNGGAFVVERLEVLIEQARKEMQEEGDKKKEVIVRPAHPRHVRRP